MRLRALAITACAIALLAAVAPGAAARPRDGVDFGVRLNACGNEFGVLAIPLTMLAPMRSDCASEK
ncbi:hypothetical protein ACFY12_09430 [Streptomyces sp. NPDC001339]|uniref:hypothetical protein n=1 Tax=Streptomyces sp. NPDC001339 TaxID=3364563 RepID=UPI0036A42B93